MSGGQIDSSPLACENNAESAHPTLLNNIDLSKPIILYPLQQKQKSTETPENNGEKKCNNTKNKAKGCRRTWSAQEDNKLIELVNSQSPVIWEVVSNHLPGRSPIQCKERYMYRLAPNIKRGKFELWEDIFVIMEHKRIGNKWTLIASKLKGRTPFHVKNRWYTYLRKIALEK